MARRPKPRRGVLLLIVLSLLVLFLLVGLSFMVSAGQFNRLAKSAARTDNTGMPGAKLADAALLQIVRGTANPYSAIHGHSLLEDLYGRDYIIISTVGNVSSPGPQQLQSLRIDLSTDANYALGHPLPEDVASGNGPQELHDDYYNGCVLTFLNGTAKGMSTRVVAYKPNSTPGQILFKAITVQNPLTGDYEKPQKPATGEPLRFIINGRPFNGTGAGYNAQSGSMDLMAFGGVPVAFLPNYKSYRENNFLVPHLDVTGTTAFNYGGLDESWDSVDYQNYFLAKGVDLAKMQDAAAAILEVQGGATVPPEVSTLLTYLQNTGGSTPSFHRPYLISHLTNNISPDALSQYQTAVMARPSTVNHPAFTGSNPLFDPVAGPWDVDANGDGIPDSVWIDAGLSPVSGPDGRLYKPLVAVHIVDMDGRININAVESLERTKARVTPSLANFRTTSGVIPVTGGTLPMGAPDNNAFGLGYGPADVSTALSGVIAPNLLRSRYAGDRKDPGNNQNAETPFNPSTNHVFLTTDSLPSPFAEVATPGFGPADSATSPTNASDDDFICDTRPVPRVPDFYSGLPATDREDQSNLPGIQVSIDTGYGSPPDYHARAMPYLDAHGNMIWAGRFLGRYDNLDDPYEINLLSPDTHDNPFDLGDLEALHRVDIAYEQSRAVERLVDGGIATTIQQYTTHSFSIPVPPTIGSGLHRGLAADVSGLPGDGLKRSLRELFAARIMRVRAAGAMPATYPQAFAQAERIMAPELIRGEKLDVNRVMIPNKPVGVIPGKTHTPPERVLLLAEKEQFARHLFNLLMLVSDQGELASFGIPLPGGNLNDQRVQHIRRLAQWAINVVDFGDADSVMTRLRYDVNPFNELEVFDAAGNVIDTTDMGIVWGMEHPEMVLTETLAFHDRRVEDGDAGGGTLDSGNDADLDSNIEPEGAAFFELLCTRSQRPTGGAWSNVTSRAPEDLYFNQSTLDLGRRNGLKPVWRLAISEIMTNSNDSPKSLVDNNRAYQNTFEPASAPGEGQGLDLELTRFVWFCDTPPTKVDNEEDTQNTFYNLRSTSTLVAPGSYFVVGPDDEVEVGLRKSGSTSPQKISLRGDHRRVHDIPASRPRQVSPATVLAPNGIPRMVGMVAESDPDVGVSVSEPLGGYSSSSSPSPLDAEDGSPIAEDLSTRTEENFRTVFLQRLADPSAPWNPREGHARHDPNAPVNPYRTVDWMPMDITIFNSLYDGSDDPDDPQPGRPLRNFASREKSGVLPGNPLLLEDRFNIWSAWTNLAPRVIAVDRAPRVAVTATDDPTLPGNLVDSCNTNVPHSLGWLNRSFDHVGVPFDGLGHFRATGPYAEAPFTPLSTNGLAEGLTGDPQTNLASTFPTLVWNNRPYANPYEMMLVPASSSASRAAEFTVSTQIAPYKGGTPLNDTFAYRGSFGHLLNFFHSSAGTKNEHDIPTRLGGNYFRLFDFVTVPSQFKGTKTWYTSNQNVWASLLWNNDPSVLDATSPLGLATNPAALSELREPGKINLNTAFDNVWNHVGFDSLLKSSATPAGVLTRAQEFELSMAGGPGNERVITDSLSVNVSGRYPNGQHPAEYPNPLRSGVGGDLVARISSASPATPSIDGTMLRGSADVANKQPILGRYALAPPNSTAQATAYTLQNRRTNPYFRFKDLMKLGNSVTSQSNVYAVWITIGYFEIEPNVNDAGEVFAIDAAHPDGYRFGIEMGSDVGQVTRHRAFYIVDRSIPVAFEPGKNHNVDKAILVRRHLE